MKVQGQRELEKVEVLRNSRVIKAFSVSGGQIDFNEVFTDSDYQDEKEVLYYYIRATQNVKKRHVLQIQSMGRSRRLAFLVNHYCRKPRKMQDHC